MQNRYVKKILPKDLLAIAGLDAICFPNGSWKVEDFSSMIDVGGFGYLVSNAGISIGFLFAQKINNEIEILRIATLPAFQRSGYADVLIIQLIASIKEKTKLFLEVRESNLHAKKLYEKHGFQEINKRDGYYKNPVESAIILARIV